MMKAGIRAAASVVDATYQVSDESKNTTQEKTNSCQYLPKWLCKKTPQRVELFLCVRHTLNLSFGFINS